MPANAIVSESYRDQEPGPLLSEAAFRALTQALDMAVLTSFAEAQLDGVPDLIVELIDLYLEDAPRRLAAIEEALARKDERALKRAAHCLRGSSANLGALQVALICEELERIECNDWFPGVQALLSCLEEEFGRVRQVLLIERQRRS
jgi:HPt (histidine-containing phosphotransfer) domain-containing protein